MGHHNGIMDDFLPGDTPWLTDDVARFLGIHRRKVGQTVRRWGILPLTDVPIEHVRNGGVLNAYRAADVIAGRAGAQEYGGRARSLDVDHLRYTPESIIEAFGGEITTWRRRRRVVIASWYQLVGLKTWICRDPADGIHHARLNGTPLEADAAELLLANQVYLDAPTESLRATRGLMPLAQRLRDEVRKRVESPRTASR